MDRIVGASEVLGWGGMLHAAYRRRFKAGTAALYSQLGQTYVPVGANVGLFWPKHGILRHPGTAVVEFLPAIEPGLTNAEFMARLEAEVETSSNALMAEAGFRG